MTVDLFPVEDYQFGNGMRIAVSTVSVMPVTAVNVSYRVGAAADPNTRSGLAHLVEHLMFQGAAHTGPGEHTRAIAEHGGTSNARTGFDRTSYFQRVPAGALELVMWLEADRMANLSSHISAERIRAQVQVVAEERRQTEEIVPHGDLLRRTLKLLFPPGHPYHHPPMGRDEDLARISVTEAAGFHRRYYNPANAVLSVVGDVRCRNVVRLAERYFGEIPSGPVTLSSERAVTAPRVSVRQDVSVGAADGLVMLAFLLPSAEDPDGEVAATAINAFGSGTNCRLHQRLVREQQVAASVTTDITQLDGVSIGMVRVHPDRAVSPAMLEQFITAELMCYADGGPTADEWQVASAQRETAWLRRLADYSGRADELARQSLLTGDPRVINRLVSQFRTMNHEHARQVARRYLGDRGYAVMACHPGSADTQ